MPTVRCLDDALWAPWQGPGGTLHVMTCRHVPADFVRWGAHQTHWVPRTPAVHRVDACSLEVEIRDGRDPWVPLTLELEHAARQVDDAAAEPTQTAATQDAAVQITSRIHDGPLQLLAAAVQELEDEHTDEAYTARLVKHAMRELRTLLDVPGSSITRDQLITALQRWASIVVHAETARRIDVADDITEASFMAYECARELVTNAGRHAGARAIVVTFGQARGLEVLTVEDDGKGIGEEWTPGYGLSAMYRRIQSAGGTIDHRPRDPVGTTVTVRLPLHT